MDMYNFAYDISDKFINLHVARQASEKSDVGETENPCIFYFCPKSVYGVQVTIMFQAGTVHNIFWEGRPIVSMWESHRM